MRKYILVFITTLISVYANASITLSDAQSKVLSTLSGSLPQEYVIYKKTKALSSVTMVGGTNLSLGSNCWTFFVDENPVQSWGHTARFVFVSVETGKVTQKSVSMCPTELGSWSVVKSKLNPISFSNASDAGDFGSHDLLKTDFIKKTTSIKAPSSKGKKYAVVISGGFDYYNNHVRYWNDCSLIYQILTRLYGYEKDNIFVYMSDGKNSGYDLRIKGRDGYNIDSPRDLDGDGKEDVTGAALIQPIQDCFASLKKKMTSNDDLFIFTTDHGADNGYMKGIGMCLWNTTLLTPTQFTNMLRGIKGNINIMMEQCFSGCFINPLATLDQNITIATAAHRGEYSWSCGEVGSLLNDFSYRWSCAVSGVDLSGNKVNADADGDGFVSMEEAFLYAEQHDYSKEHPQYWCAGKVLYDALPDDYRTISNYFNRIGKLGQYQFLGSSVGCDYSIPKDQNIATTISNKNISFSGWNLYSKSNITKSNVHLVANNSVKLQKGFKCSSDSKFLSFIYLCSNNSLKSVIAPELIEDYQPLTIYVDTEDDISIVNIYPNPSPDVFYVNLGDEKATVAVFDMKGRCIRTYTDAVGTLEINLTEQNNGIYNVVVDTKSHHVTKKIIKER